MLTYIRAVEKYLRRRKRAIKILAPMLFGLVFMILCIVNITRSLSPSEVHCANLVREEFPTVLKTAFENKQSPAYILALKTWSHFLGHTDFAMRMLSVVCGALIVLLVYYIMRRIFGLRVALPAAFLTATSPLLVALGQSINSWIFITLEAFVIIFILLFFVFRRHSIRLSPIFSIAALVLCISNIGGLVAVFTHKPSDGKELSQTIATLDNYTNLPVVCNSDDICDVLAFYSRQKIYHETDFNFGKNAPNATWFITTIDQDGNPHTEYERTGWRVAEYSTMQFNSDNVYAIVKLEKE
jgi:hypothetical protein